MLNNLKIGAPTECSCRTDKHLLQEGPSERKEKKAYLAYTGSLYDKLYGEGRKFQVDQRLAKMKEISWHENMTSTILINTANKHYFPSHNGTVNVSITQLECL